jgi:hypothetical protein
MTRTLPALAAALFAATTFLAPAAQACISCNYTPEVVNTPVYSHGAKVYAKKRVYTAAKKQAAPAKRQVVEIERKARKVETAKADPIEAAPVALDVESENSTISTASVEKAETVAAAEPPAKEPKTIGKAAGNVGCKKFFPTVGMTLTVPCE